MSSPPSSQRRMTNFPFPFRLRSLRTWFHNSRLVTHLIYCERADIFISGRCCFSIGCSASHRRIIACTAAHSRPMTSTDEKGNQRSDICSSKAHTRGDEFTMNSISNRESLVARAEQKPFMCAPNSILVFNLNKFGLRSGLRRSRCAV